MTISCNVLKSLQARVRRSLQTPACVSLPMEEKWVHSKSFKLPSRTSAQQDTAGGKTDVRVQHLFDNHRTAFKRAQVDPNRSWLVEKVAPALPSVTGAAHTERRPLWHGRLVGTNSSSCSQGNISALDRRMARSYRSSSSSRGSFYSTSTEWSSGAPGENFVVSDTLPSILISPPVSKVKLLQVMGRQKDLCVKSAGPATSPYQSILTPRLPYPIMKSYRYKGKGDSKTRRERTVLPFKVFNFCDDKVLPRVRVWRGNQTVHLATTVTLLPKGI
ncbi:uncharacterized protein LOC118426372 [Branchiostoma floridae]|uniref:Uncharacterized protein LOC118426372 n=1 Tax=Branchiostoma floridae TaxID=7739 RepID=A0A9J7LZE3_BRAFL|nr:uncharacterized protein LOC118426372 [Branchiostoma floridae]